VATITRVVGRLDVAEEAVQEACAVALGRWPVEGVPANPRAWLIATARNKAVDRLRREGTRAGKEAASMRELNDDRLSNGPDGDDQLSLIFMCCHPALDRDVRVALTLRALCGLSTAEIASAFLVPEPTMAKRLVRAKHKISQAGIPFRIPAQDQWATRLGDVLRVVYLIFTEGHMATTGAALVRAELCDTAIELARQLAALAPEEPEVLGLLALLLLTDARRPARTDTTGDLVLLEDQDRTLWTTAKITEGDELLVRALEMRHPGPYQLWAAIAACHSTAASREATDWRQIAALYGELVRYEPTPVVEANRAVAVAMAEGPAAGLVILDVVALHPQLSRWPQLHIARADLLGRLGRHDEAAAAYQSALELEPAQAERLFIHRRLGELSGYRCRN
jgi:RNA polymerase sigma-70 factor (ECF subfamily)